MRVFSFCQESQRYCNYSKDKFNNEITFIRPVDMEIDLTHFDMQSFSNSAYFTEAKPTDTFIFGLLNAEESYLQLLEQGYKPQEARAVLPNATKTEIFMTGFIDDWVKFFELRCSEAAHPQIRDLAIRLKAEFIKRGYING